MGTGGRAKRIAISGKAIRFPPKATLVLGIALNELATNAEKYGAFSSDTGSILIAWTMEPAPDGDRLSLRWQEKNGQRVAPPSRLAVAGASREHPWVLVFGLALSIVLMGVAAAFIARLLQRHRWIAYVGLAVILYVALDMIWRGANEVWPYTGELNV